MNRLQQYQAAIDRRNRRRRRTEARAVANCPFSKRGLYGSTLRPEQLPDFIRCAEAMGGEWLWARPYASTSHLTLLAPWVIFLSTKNTCADDGCTTDHAAGGVALLADLLYPKTMTPISVVAYRSPGWQMNGLQYAFGDGGRPR